MVTVTAPARQPSEIVVLDDSVPFQEALTSHLVQIGLRARGFSEVDDFARALRAGKLVDADLMFVDMRLGVSKDGFHLTALDAILFARTYAPLAKIVIFTQLGASLDEYIRCVELGALGVIPKSNNLADFDLAAQIYPHIGNADRALDAVIQTIWSRLKHAPKAEKGGLLEMLVANLFRSMPGFEVVSNNRQTVHGELDLVVAITSEHRVWRELGSYHLVVECKHRSDPSETSDFATLIGKVRGKGKCEAGLMIAWNGVSGGFKNLQASDREAGRIFTLERADLEAMVIRAPVDRETYLRSAIEQQF